MRLAEMMASMGTGSPKQECVLTVRNPRHGPVIVGRTVLERAVGGWTDSAKLHNRSPPGVDDCESLFSVRCTGLSVANSASIKLQCGSLAMKAHAKRSQ